MTDGPISIDTGTDELLCEIRDRVAVITLNRPEARNSLSDHLTPALRRMIKRYGDDPDVGALLITGAGSAFCSGGDVARELGLNLFLKLVMRLLSRGARKKAKSLGVRFSFLFMRAQGQQLSEITSLIESGVIRPVVDKIFPFEKTGDALAYVETGRAKGKVVIAVKQKVP
jgi:hypothetical protein